MNLTFIVLLEKCKIKNFQKKTTQQRHACQICHGISITNLAICNIHTTDGQTDGRTDTYSGTSYVYILRITNSLSYFSNSMLLQIIPSGLSHGVEYLNGGLWLRVMNGAA